MQVSALCASNLVCREAAVWGAREPSPRLEPPNNEPSLRCLSVWRKGVRGAFGHQRSAPVVATYGKYE